MSDHQVRIQPFRSVLNDRFVLVLTSNSIEKSAVNSVLTSMHSAEIGIPRASSRIGLLGRQVVLHISGESGGSRELSVGRLVTKFVLQPDMPRPILIVLIGFCWGNPRLTKSGDVIVSKSILSLNQRRVGPSGPTYVALPFESKLDLGNELLEHLNHKIAPENIRILRGRWSASRPILGPMLNATKL
jgi:hypothetical protein